MQGGTQEYAKMLSMTGNINASTVSVLTASPLLRKMGHPANDAEEEMTTLILERNELQVETSQPHTRNELFPLVAVDVCLEVLLQTEDKFWRSALLAPMRIGA